MRDHNIDVLTMTDVLTLDGEAGRFRVGIRKRPRGVRADKCTGCGDCWTVCPVRCTAESPPPFQPSVPLNETDAAVLRDILARHEGNPGAMMPVLQEVNQAYGYIPRGTLEHLACLWQMRLAEILRVASFYDRFHLEPVGRHVVEVPRARRAMPAVRGPCSSGWNSGSALGPAKPTRPAVSRCGRSAAWGCAHCRRR